MDDDNILGHALHPQPTSFSVLKWCLYISLIVLVPLLPMVWEAYKRRSEQHHHLVVRRRFGIPDSDRRPFGVAASGRKRKEAPPGAPYVHQAPVHVPVPPSVHQPVARPTVPALDVPARIQPVHYVQPDDSRATSRKRSFDDPPYQDADQRQRVNIEPLESQTLPSDLQQKIPPTPENHPMDVDIDTDAASTNHNAPLTHALLLTRGKKRDRTESGSIRAGGDVKRHRRKSRRTSDALEVAGPRGKKRDAEYSDVETEQGDMKKKKKKKNRYKEGSTRTSSTLDGESLWDDDAHMDVPLEAHSDGQYKVGDEWTVGGVKFRLGPNGERMRLCLVKKVGRKFVMPEDTDHPDAGATLSVCVETWLTDEGYVNAKRDGLLAFQDKGESSLNSQDPSTPQDKPHDKGKQLFYSHANSPSSTPTTPGTPRRSMDATFLLPAAPPSPPPGATAGRRSRLSLGMTPLRSSISSDMIEADVIATPGKKWVTKWEKQESEAEGLRRLREAREKSEKAKPTSTPTAKPTTSLPGSTLPTLVASSTSAPSPSPLTLTTPSNAPVAPTASTTAAPSSTTAGFSLKPAATISTEPSTLSQPAPQTQKTSGFSFPPSNATTSTPAVATTTQPTKTAFSFGPTAGGAAKPPTTLYPPAPAPTKPAGGSSQPQTDSTTKSPFPFGAPTSTAVPSTLTAPTIPQASVPQSQPTAAPSGGPSLLDRMGPPTSAATSTAGEEPGQQQQTASKPKLQFNLTSAPSSLPTASSTPSTLKTNSLFGNASQTVPKDSIPSSMGTAPAASTDKPLFKFPSATAPVTPSSVAAKPPGKLTSGLSDAPSASSNPPPGGFSLKGATTSEKKGAENSSGSGSTFKFGASSGPEATGKDGAFSFGSGQGAFGTDGKGQKAFGSTSSAAGQTPLFGQKPSSAFGVSTSSSSAFLQGIKPPSESTPSAFGAAPSTLSGASTSISEQPKSLFGSTAPPASSLFAPAPPSSLAGPATALNSTTSSAPNAFGGNPTKPSNTLFGSGGSGFGNTQSGGKERGNEKSGSTSGSGSAFSFNVKPSSSQQAGDATKTFFGAGSSGPSLFSGGGGGGGEMKSPASGSLFGSQASKPTPSLFGSSAGNAFGASSSSVTPGASAAKLAGDSLAVAAPGTVPFGPPAVTSVAPSTTTSLFAAKPMGEGDKPQFTFGAGGATGGSAFGGSGAFGGGSGAFGGFGSNNSNSTNSNATAGTGNASTTSGGVFSFGQNK